MSAAFEITALAPELMDAVICMENSPAYDAFREEMEAILKDFSEKETLSANWKIDESKLTKEAEDTLKNMHRAYLIWTYAEELDGKQAKGTSLTFVKLFMKNQLDTIIALNNGSGYVDAADVKGLVAKYKSKIIEDDTVYASVKEFFKGYVYGYFFNFLDEAVIMKKYAEMFAYLGVMSGKVNAGIMEQQKILPKMAMLLVDDRFKYLTGFIPRDHMLKRVMDRVDFASMSTEESDKMKATIIAYMDENYKQEKEDNIPLIEDSVSASILSAVFEKYIDVVEFSNSLYNNYFSGVRTFLDADKDDTGEYTADKICKLISAKCMEDADSYYSSADESKLDTALDGEEKAYKYPLVTKDKDRYYFASICEELIYPVLDEDIYQEVEKAIPEGMLPFAAETTKTNCIRIEGKLDKTGITVRKDKMQYVEKISELINNADIDARERKMLILEQALYIMSGNCSEEKYKKLIKENLFEDSLYDDYIHYRMDVLFKNGTKGLDEKKVLLDKLNSIV